MIHRALLAIYIGSVLSLSGCLTNAPLVTGSGTLVTQTHSAENFDSLDVTSAFDVTAQPGAEYAVEITADDNLIQYVSVQQIGSQLQLGLSQRLRLHNATLKANITVPILRSVNLSNASTLHINGIECSDLTLDVSGASRINGELFASDMSLDLSGASQIQLAGKCEDLTVDASGASSANLEELIAASCSIDASGASQVHVHTLSLLNVDVSGASRVTYNDEADVGRIETSGASSVSRR